MNIFSYLQKLGKALMLPIASLPVAALLLRLGQPDLLDIRFIAEAGNAIFSNLPLLFAMGIGAGLSRDGDGAAVIAGAIGYLVLTNAADTINNSIDMSFFGGIIAGIIAGHVYNRFHATILPPYLGFFGGKRLVPIITGLTMLLVGWVCGWVWPMVQSGIDAFGHEVAESGAAGQFLYGVLNRALVPLGLHHVLNSYFWFGLGDFINADGELVTGDLSRFFAGDPTAGAFMAGFFPVTMFGLPAGALAMYLAAPRANRARVGGALFSVALTAFLTGITEPLEFMFMFLAPILYALHAVLTGLSLVIANLSGALHGFGFSAGFFDFVLNWGIATRPEVLLLQGLGTGVVYLVSFYALIKLMNLETPGRDEEVVEKSAEVVVIHKPAEAVTMAAADTPTGKAQRYLALLGGIENLETIDACITRLRLNVCSPVVASDAEFKALGARGVIRVGEKSIQVVLGPEAETIAGIMRSMQVAEAEPAL